MKSCFLSHLSSIHWNSESKPSHPPNCERKRVSELLLQCLFNNYRKDKRTSVQSNTEVSTVARTKQRRETTSKVSKVSKLINNFPVRETSEGISRGQRPACPGSPSVGKSRAEASSVGSHERILEACAELSCASLEGDAIFIAAGGDEGAIGAGDELDSTERLW